MTAKVDPKLTAAIKSASRTKRPVAAYVVIRSPTRGSTAAAAKSVLGRVARETHTKAVRSQYLELLDSIHVEAVPVFMRTLLKQPEVVTASPPPCVKGSAMIKPLKPRRAKPEAIDVPLRRRENA